MLFSKKEKERKEPVVEESSLPSELEDITAMESARRAQEERAYRLADIRSFLRSFFIGLITVALFFGIWFGVRAVVNLPYFNLTKLVIEGDTNKVSPTRLKEVVQPVIDGNFFFVNLEKVREAVRQVPWVRSASVRRVWPDELHVQFTTRRAVAVYEDGRLVDAQGELFVGNPDEQEVTGETLPNFSGTAALIPDILRYYQDFSRAVRPLGVEVTSVSCSDRGSWSLTFSSKEFPPTRVELGLDRGRGEKVIEKLVNVVVAYPSIREVFQGPPTSIDARYNQAFSASPPDKDYQAPLVQDLDVPVSNEDADLDETDPKSETKPAK